MAVDEELVPPEKLWSRIVQTYERYGPTRLSYGTYGRRMTDVRQVWWPQAVTGHVRQTYDRCGGRRLSLGPPHT